MPFISSPSIHNGTRHHTLTRWPITMAQRWPRSTFVGLDVVPVQIDLSTLARQQAASRRREEEDTRRPQVDYVDIEGRVRWQLGNL
jgi:uncharacterized membrane protein